MTAQVIYIADWLRQRHLPSLVQEPAVKRFVVGQTYSTRSVCDHDTIMSFAVVARTEKTVTIVGRHHDGLAHVFPLRRGISVYEGVEQFKPYGSYSMCPVVGADDPDLTPSEKESKP